MMKARATRKATLDPIFEICKTHSSKGTTVLIPCAFSLKTFVRPASKSMTVSRVGIADAVNIVLIFHNICSDSVGIVEWVEEYWKAL